VKTINTLSFGLPEYNDRVVMDGGI